MGPAADVDALVSVLIEHPWLVAVLEEADWWRYEDGSLRLHAEIQDTEEARSGLIAFAEALGLSLEESSAGAGPVVALPEEPPMTFEEALRPEGR